MNDKSNTALVHQARPPASNVVYDATATAKDHLIALSALHIDDKAVERRWKWTRIVAGAVALIGGIAGAVVGAIPGLIFLAFEYHRQRTRDVEDRKLDAVRGLLDTLQSEVRQDRAFPVRIDFRGYSSTLKSGMFSKPAEFGIEDWLALRVPLVDGTRLTVTASTKVKQKFRRKRKGTKVKHRLVDDLTLAFSAPSGRDLVVDDRVLTELLQKVRLRVTKVGCANNTVSLAFRLGPATRVRDRGAWNASGFSGMLNGVQLVRHIAMSYRALVSLHGKA